MTDKLKIGILDLLTILLPGAYLLIVAWYYYQGYEPLKSLLHTEKPFFKYERIDAALLIGAAYILGHFIFFIASFLDDFIYEKVRKVYWHEHNKLTAYILKLKEKRTGIGSRKVMNAFKWSNAYLISKEPAIYGEVERYLAESKFFRSLCIVLSITLIILVSKETKNSLIVLTIILTFLSLIRYLTQRQKSIQTAYHAMITLGGEVFPKDPDWYSLKEVEKNFYDKIKTKENDSEDDVKSEIRLWFDNLLYSIIKFLYTVALCIVPFFEILTTKTKKPKPKTNV